jgi:peptide/nickel transport system permease protein/glutathione transport system permease protein
MALDMAATATGVEESRNRTGRAGRPGPLVITAMVIIAVAVLLALFGTWLTPYSPTAQDPALSITAPSGSHLLGTDNLGRDVLSRLIAGAGTSLLAPLLVVIGTDLIGVSLGLIAGYYGRAVDMCVSRVADLVYSLPGLLIAVVIVGISGGNYWLAIAVLIILLFPGSFRVIRATSLVQSRLPYVEAARALGLPRRRIILRHVLPNVAPNVIASVMLDFVGALLIFSALAFLGLGVNPDGVSWGSMIAEGQGVIFQNPLLALAPALLIVATATSVTIVGDWAYDRMLAAREL